MQDPVVAMDDYTYERYAIEAHTVLPLSLMSGELFSSRILSYNRLAHDLIVHLYVDEVHRERSLKTHDAISPRLLCT